MYEFIKGNLAHAGPSKAVVNVGGLGLGIAIGANAYQQLPQVGSEVTFFVSFIVREDSQTLYGFLTEWERDFFEKLTQISGVGPKTAIALIGHFDLIDLQMAIMKEEIAILSRAPGVGKKIAERIIVEMRDRLKKDKKLPPALSSTGGSTVSDAISALMQLGYHITEAQKAVKGKEQLPLEELIPAALGALARK